ncbi:MAG: nucleoside triphosphate pyrophosphohydrolase [Thermodesulfovibrionales bacterium]|nr:nucleoside triphosphate pyrophosphohydrolase [Thermodesulfovibrionales bacterium]
MEEFKELIEIMAKLRSDSGCPWDRQQTKDSLKPYLIEEAHEVLEAIDEGDSERLKEELGDLLFQIIFQSQIAAEKGDFSIKDVIVSITKKIIKRHPHVFSKVKFDSAEEVAKQWFYRKNEEGKFEESLLNGIPKTLPALQKAQRLQSRVAMVGFDWVKTDDVVLKVEEELSELKAAIQSRSEAEIEEEIGDLLFVVVNLSRFLNVDAEEALKKSINKFIRRFSYIETKAKEKGKRLTDMTLEEMDEIWELTKLYDL